jgi:hypothetical protein
MKREAKIITERSIFRTLINWGGLNSPQRARGLLMFIQETWSNAKLKVIRRLLCSTMIAEQWRRLSGPREKFIFPSHLGFDWPRGHSRHNGNESRMQMSRSLADSITPDVVLLCLEEKLVAESQWKRQLSKQQRESDKTNKWIKMYTRRVQSANCISFAISKDLRFSLPVCLIAHTICLFN